MSKESFGKRVDVLETEVTSIKEEMREFRAKSA
jgi:hypothetical protein